MSNIILVLFLILFEAIPEALAETGRKTFAGVLEFIYRALVTLILFAFVGGAYLNLGVQDYFFFHIAGYVLIRFAVFDLIYNGICGLPWYYIGSTKLFDRMFGWLMTAGKVPNSIILFTKGILLFIGIVWILK
jgi:hypothetical protein